MTPPRLEGPRSPAIRQARALAEERPRRDRERLYVAWGVHLAQEAIAAGAPIRRAFFGERLEATREGRAVLQRLRAARVPLLPSTTRALDAIAEGCGDQGVALIVARADAQAVVPGGASLVLAAHGVQDPGNLGGIMRSALALGADGLAALPGSADPFGPRVVRAAMGAHFRLPIVAAGTTPWLEAIGAARLALVAADPRGDRTPREADLATPSALLVGAEGSGLPDDLLAAADIRVRIPMAAGVSSLNVAIAAAVLLYEAGRQRGVPR